MALVADTAVGTGEVLGFATRWTGASAVDTFTVDELGGGTVDGFAVSVDGMRFGRG